MSKVENKEHVIKDILKYLNIKSEKTKTNVGSFHVINSMIFVDKSFFEKKIIKQKVKKQEGYSIQDLNRMRTNGGRLETRVPQTAFDLSAAVPRISERTISSRSSDFDTYIRQTFENTINNRERTAEERNVFSSDPFEITNPEFEEVQEESNPQSFDSRLENLSRQVNDLHHHGHRPSESYVSKTSQKIEEKKVILRKSNIEKIYDKLNNEYGYIPCQVKAYIVNNSIILDSVEELNKFALVKQVKSINYLITGYVQDGKNLSNVKQVLKVTSQNNAYTISPDILTFCLPLFYSLKIEDCDISSSLFGLKKIKNSLVNVQDLDWNICEIKSKKLGKETGFFVNVVKELEYNKNDENNTHKELKFVLFDCIFNFKNSNIKGYNLPKVKDIFVSNNVNIIKRFVCKYKFSVEDIISNNFKVISIKENRASKRVFKDSKRRKLDIITIMSNVTGINYTVYGEHIKLAETLKKEQYVKKVEIPF